MFLLVATSTAVMISCSKSSYNAGTTNNSDFSNQLTASNWGVHYFFYNSTDQTKQFSSYVFTFKKDSTLDVANSTESYHGGWYARSQSDNSVILTINIASLTQIQLLANSWKVTSNDGMLIVLKDYTGMTDKELHLFRK